MLAVSAGIYKHAWVVLSPHKLSLTYDFRWGVFHHFRVERNMGILKVWLDEIPTPQKHLFSDIIQL
jgi:hypothetical protein